MVHSVFDKGLETLRRYAAPIRAILPSAMYKGRFSAGKMLTISFAAIVSRLRIRTSEITRISDGRGSVHVRVPGFPEFPTPLRVLTTIRRIIMEVPITPPSNLPDGWCAVLGWSLTPISL